MIDDAIRKALEVAATRICICEGECYETRHGMMNGPCERETSKAAAAIAAFLRALPKYDNEGDAIPYDAELLAAAIRARLATMEVAQDDR